MNKLYLCKRCHKKKIFPYNYSGNKKCEECHKELHQKDKYSFNKNE